MLGLGLGLGSGFGKVLGLVRFWVSVRVRFRVLLAFVLGLF